MPRMRIIGILAAVGVALPTVALTGDWGADLAKKAVGHAAREGIEHALKDEVLEETLDAAGRRVARGAVTHLDERYRHVDDLVDVGEAVGDGVEVAMRVSDVADKLDDAADVAKTLKKVNNIRKIGR